MHLTACAQEMCTNHMSKINVAASAQQEADLCCLNNLLCLLPLLQQVLPCRHSLSIVLLSLLLLRQRQVFPLHNVKKLKLPTLVQAKHCMLRSILGRGQSALHADWKPRPWRHTQDWGCCNMKRQVE